MKRATPQEYFEAQANDQGRDRMYILAMTLGVIACVSVAAVAISYRKE